MDDTAAYATHGKVSAAELHARIADKHWHQPMPTPDEAEALMLEVLRAVIASTGDTDFDFCGLGDFSCANGAHIAVTGIKAPALSQAEFIVSTREAADALPQKSERGFILVQPPQPAEACSELLSDDHAWPTGAHALEPWFLRHPTATTFALLCLLLTLWGLAGWSDGPQLPGEGEAYADELAAEASFYAPEVQP